VVQLGQFSLPPGKLLLLTVGNLNRNKRVDEVIAYLAADRDLAARVYYLVCGDVELSARERLERLIRSTGLADTVRLTGRVGAAELHSLMKAADICINLRNPAMEGGSASLVELMLYGKAGVVSDTGVYADMPDDCILKVRPEREAEDLADALSRLVSDAALRKRLGLRAREYAESNFTPSAYAGRLLAFLDDVGSLKPVFLPAYRASRILSDMNIRPDMPIVRTVAEMCAEMFCRPADSAPFNRK
jgi:glycosyltransferase involved in cell wall biosynthesis